MLLPIQTSLSPKRTPYANYLLIIANVIVFLLSYGPHRVGPYVESLRNWAIPFMLTPEHPYIWQFVSYAFLHGGWMHLLGNMYFLYMFGNNVNDRLGNIGYLCFFLAGAVFSGLGHTLLHTNTVLGASGAVAAVTGAYLVLFPHTYISVLFMFFFIGTFEIKAMYLIAIKLIIFDNVIEKHFSAANIAFDAHLAGYAFGILSVLGLLAFKLIDSSYDDLLGSLRQWHRRRKFRDVVNESYDPWGKPTARKTVNSSIKTPDEPDSQSAEILDLRGKISQSMNAHNTSEALQLYQQLLNLDPQQILPRQMQLEIANQLMSDRQWNLSAAAYELFLQGYSNYEYAEQVHLMLGLLYGRYLNDAPRALEYLHRAKDRLTDAEQKSLCDQEIRRLENA